MNVNTNYQKYQQGKKSELVKFLTDNRSRWISMIKEIQIDKNLKQEYDIEDVLQELALLTVEFFKDAKYSGQKRTAVNNAYTRKFNKHLKKFFENSEDNLMLIDVYNISIEKSL